MKIKTTKFGEQEIDLTPHLRKKGLNNIVESIIKELKQTTRVSATEKALLHVEIRSQFLDA